VCGASQRAQRRVAGQLGAAGGGLSGCQPNLAARAHVRAVDANMPLGHNGNAAAVVDLKGDGRFFPQRPQIQQDQQAIDQPKPAFLHGLYFSGLALFLHPIVGFDRGFRWKGALQVNPGQLQGDGAEGVVAQPLLPERFFLLAGVGIAVDAANVVGQCIAKNVAADVVLDQARQALFQTVPGFLLAFIQFTLEGGFGLGPVHPAEAVDELLARHRFEAAHHLFAADPGVEVFAAGVRVAHLDLVAEVVAQLGPGAKLDEGGHKFALILNNQGYIQSGAN